MMAVGDPRAQDKPGASRSAKEDKKMAAKPIVAGTDGSEESLRAVDWAAREAVLRGAPLRIVSAATLLPRMVLTRRPGPIRHGDRRADRGA